MRFIGGLLLSFSLAAQSVAQTKAAASSQINKTQIKATQGTKKKKVKASKTIDTVVLPGDVSDKGEKELIALIQGFQAIIKNPAQKKNRNSYLISQMAAYLALARVYRLRKDPTEKDRKNEAIALERVQNYAHFFLKTKSANQQDRSKALFYGGQAQIYLNDYNKAIDLFQQAISTDPNSPYIGTMSMFIAETWFEDEKFDDAIKQYNAHFSKLNQIEKALAIYKIGWCLLNLGRYSEAEKNFLLLIGKDWAGHFSTDSLKDLSYTATLFRTEPEIIEQSYILFRDPEIQIEYLYQAFNYFLAQSSSTKHPLLFAELMRRLKDPGKKLELLLTDLRGSHKQFASRESFRSFLKIEELFRVEKLNFESQAYKDQKEPLEMEVLYIAKAFGDTITGKTKSPEAFTQEELYRSLRYLLNFHLTYFPESKERSNSYTSLLSLCNKQKDYNCIYQLSNKILKENISEEFRAVVNLEKINAIEMLLPGKPELKGEQIQLIEEYLTKYPQTDKWLILAKKLTVLLNSEKSYDKSIIWLEKIHARENTSESLYRLQLARFDLGDFKGVASYSNVIPKDENGEKVQKLMNESYVRLAEAGISKNDFDTYEKNMALYLATTNDKSKLDAGRADYFERLLQRNEYEKVTKDLLALSFVERFGVVFGPVSRRVIVHDMEKMNWGGVVVFFKDRGSINIPQDLRSPYLYSLLARNEKLTPAEFAEFQASPKEEREYYLGLMALAQTDYFMEYYKEFKLGTKFDKSLLYLCHQIKQGKEEPQLSDSEKVYLFEVLPATHQVKKIKTLTILSWMQVPRVGQTAKSYEKLLKDSIEKIRSVRTQIGKDLKILDYDRQVEILEKASQMEKRVSASVMTSPLPTELDESQKSEYEAQLKELADEFNNQSDEYIKLRLALDQEREKRTEANYRAMDLSLWPWPKGDKFSALQNTLSGKNFLSALLALDQYRNRKEISSEDYYAAKGRMMFLLVPNEFGAIYLRRELEAAGQTELLKKWDLPPNSGSKGGGK